MKFQHTLSIAIKSISANKVRSFLTMLGVIIGVGSVVMLISIGRGLELYITEQFESLGANNVIVLPGNVFSERGFDRESQASALLNNQLKSSDMDDIGRLRTYVEQVTAINSQTDIVSFQSDRTSSSIIGTTSNYPEVLNTPMEKGRFFNQAEENAGRNVVVLGHQIAEDIFNQVDPIGKRVRINQQNFRVIGVAEKIGGGFGGPSFDNYSYIPIGKAQRLYDTDTVLQIVAKIKSKDLIDEAIVEIENLLLRRLDEDDFSVIDQSDILNTINDILRIVTVGLGGIAAISLLVGGIGIMNIMLVSVTERTQEIGLRKALGATPKQILLQFLIEAALLSVIGGLIGLGLAYLGASAIQPYFPARITIEAVVLAFSVSTIVGLVFGAAPAHKASLLSPI